jgi:hypothetical protein
MTRPILLTFAVAAMLSIAMPSVGAGESKNYGKPAAPIGKPSGSSSTAAKKNSTASPNTLSTGERKSKSGHLYLKLQDIAGESGDSSRGKGASPPPPPPKGDCMSCAD